MDSRNKIFLVIGTVAILGAAGFSGMMLFTQQGGTDVTSSSTTNADSSVDSSSTNDTVASDSSTSSSTGSTGSTATYKDGTYTSTKTYSVPRGNTNSITSTVVIADGKITSVTTENTYSDHESAEYVDAFESAVSSSAVGESISSYSPTRISGASLTTSAFSSTISSIRSQAQS